MKKFKSFKDFVKDDRGIKPPEHKYDSFEQMKEEIKKETEQKRINEAKDRKDPEPVIIPEEQKNRNNEMKIVRQINEVLKYRDPILEKMTYEEWIIIPQNKEIAELNEYHAKLLYEQDMDRADKVQAAGRASGGGVRKRKVTTEAVTYYWDPTKLPGCRLWLDASDATTIVQETLPTASNANLTSSFPDVVCWLDAGDSGSFTTDSWLPTTIPSCSLWLDADDASSMTIDGSNKISEWRNKSTEFTGLFDYGQSLGTKQPLLVASEVNGKPVVRFDGSDDQMEGSGSLTHYSPAATNDELTVFYVLKYYPSIPADNVGNYVAHLWGVDSGYNYDAATLFTSMSDLALSYGYGLKIFMANSISDGTVGFTTDPLIYSVVNESGGDIFLTGSDINASYNALPNTLAYPASSGDRYSLLGGKSYTGDKNFPGDIAEVICYARNLSTAERTTVETYLQNKWDITVATQSTDVYTNKISQWRDKSGNSNHFGQTVLGDQPVLSASSMSGFQSAYNDGSEFMTASNIFMTSSGDTTVFVVGQTTTAVTQWDMIVGCDGWDYTLGISNGAYIYEASDLHTSPHFFNVPAYTPGYFCFQNDINNLASTTTNGADGAPFNPLNSNSTISSIAIGGHDTSTTNRHTGDMVEFIFFTRSLDDNERISIERYLSNKYNITPHMSSSVRNKQWTDKSGQGNHVVSEGWTWTPQYTSSIGSQSFGFYPVDDPVVPNTVFGSNHNPPFMTTTTGSVIQSLDDTIFLVFTPRRVSSWNQIILQGREVHPDGLIGVISSKQNFYNGSYAEGLATVTQDTRYIFTYNYNFSAGTWEYHQDGTPNGSGVLYGANPDFSDDRYKIGWDAPVNIHEFLVYTGSITGTDRTAVETYLQNKWSVTVATQSTDPVLGSDNSYTP